MYVDIVISNAFNLNKHFFLFFFFFSGKENDQNYKRKYNGQSTNDQTKENVLNQIKEIENKWKISINTKENLTEMRAIAVIKKNPKYFFKFVKNNPTIRAGIGPLQD